MEFDREIPKKRYISSEKRQIDQINHLNLGWKIG